MLNKSYITLFLAVLSISLSAQSVCRKQYDRIKEIELNAKTVLEKEGSIRQAKKQTKQALKLAYAAIATNDCKAYYSKFVDQIIELELKLGNVSKAEQIALERLDQSNPNWRALDASVNLAQLSILVKISHAKHSASFYQKLRRKQRGHAVCGTTTYAQDVAELYNSAQILFTHYGKIYALKFLQNSSLLIVEEEDAAKVSWDKIYDLLLQSLQAHFSYQTIKHQYESAAIQKAVMQEALWSLDLPQSPYYIQLGAVKLYFKAKQQANSQSLLENYELIKSNSELYKKIEAFVVRGKT